MEKRINILEDPLEQMLADCEDNVRDGIRTTFLQRNAEAYAMYEPDNLVTVDLKEVIKVDSPFTDTVEGMLSPDYKERFKAEYRQTKIRYDKLHAMLVKADAGKLEFIPTCPLELLRDQKACMGKYLYHLEVRAQIEGIEL